MIAVLHLGEFDGAQFDMRPWTRVPEIVYCRRGGAGKLGLALSQTRRENSVGYRYASAKSNGEYHYRLDENDGADGLHVSTGLDREEVLEAA